MGPLCQVHINSQQGSKCNRDSLLTGRWEASGRLWIYSPSPGSTRAPAVTGCIYQILPSYIPHFTLSSSVFLPVIPLPCFPTCPNMPIPSLVVFLPAATSTCCDQYLMCTSCVFGSLDITVKWRKQQEVKTARRQTIAGGCF